MILKHDQPQNRITKSASHCKNRFLILLIFLAAGVPMTTANAAPRQCPDSGGAATYLSQLIKGMTAEVIADDFISEVVLSNKDEHIRRFWETFKTREDDIETLVKDWNASRVAKNAVLDRRLFVDMLRQLRKMIVAFEKPRQSAQNAANLLAGEWNDWRAKYMTRDQYIRQFLAEAESRHKKLGISSYGAVLQAAQAMLNRLDNLHGAAGSRDAADDPYQMWSWDSYIRRKAADTEIKTLISMRDGEAYLNEYLITRKTTIKCVAGKFIKDDSQATRLTATPNPPTQRAFAEPSEKEMHAAVAAKFAQINADLSTLAKRCERREFRNDPLLAMQCLTVCGAGGGSCSMSFELTRFEKLGCEKAEGQPGYVCDYVAGFSSNSPFAKGAMNRLTGGGDTGQGRFLWRNDGWMFLPMNRR